MSKVRNYLGLIKFSHTIFAMPFALIGFCIATTKFEDLEPIYSNQEIDTKLKITLLSFRDNLLLLFSIIVCMIFARSAAMAFNRYLDRKFDAKNPRTAIREIPSGIITPKNALLFTVVCSLLFIVCCFFINRLCFYLSPVALAIVLGYSYTKRFTPLCHLILGLGLSLAPIGAFIAVTGFFSFLPIIFSLVVLFWVSGFDIIYALQDEEFDRSQKLYSMPAWLGKSKVLDNTVSPMGARLLKRWIVFPLKDMQKINERLDTVEQLIKETDLRNKITQHIKLCGDIERLVSKIPLKKINPREVLQLARGLKQVDAIKQLCISSTNEYLKRLGDALNPCPYIAEKIFKEIVDNPPALTVKGGMMNSGVSPELDELRKIAHSGKSYLAQMQQKEAEATGISSLKIGFNNVFGYYLEVTNSHKNKVPAEWMRKQTLTNAERYITPELKEYEEKITGAEEKILKTELELFEALLNELSDYLAPVQTNGTIVAVLDCLCCFANNAIHYQYKKPDLHTGDEMIIREGRHPVIERNLPVGETYISNDLELNKTDQQLIILTGPNMSGKSALLRQTALITLMAHMGSFVPASDAKISLTDKIFTRVGASDNLSGGESTFMVEMNETASIINNITGRSLVLLDEIGRGTSTYDGISIAWSIAEHLHNSPYQPKTLFATHYHELNELEEKFSRVKNYHITNKELGNRIIFLRKLARGGSTHSFGIHVARMAGMPPSLIDRANEVLRHLESIHENQESGPDSNRDGSLEPENLEKKIKNLATSKMQLSIFDAHSETFEEIRKLLQDLDINRLTPVEALLKLQEIKNKLK